MESVLWDAESQNLSGTAWFGFFVGEDRNPNIGQGDRMTKAESFDEAWRLASRGDFSLVDKVYHPDYRAFDAYAEVEVNLEAEKVAVETFSEILTATNSKVLSESNDFLRIHRYNRHRDAEVFASVTTSITYKDGLIITQQSEVEELDYDPSEGQDWIWEDFE